VAQEAAATQRLLGTTIQAGTALTALVQSLVDGINNGEVILDRPDFLDASYFKTLFSALNAHTQATERAVKLVRLIAGEPTERTEHRIAALVAGCTTEELQQLAETGRIPPRLARVTDGGPSPAPDEAGPADRAAARAAAIDAEFEDLNDDAPRPLVSDVKIEKPSWIDEIAPPEGVAKDITRTDDDTHQAVADLSAIKAEAMRQQDDA
jgi:hypothetical protein